MMQGYQSSQQQCEEGCGSSSRGSSDTIRSQFQPDGRGIVTMDQKEGRATQRCKRTHKQHIESSRQQTF